MAKDALYRKKIIILGLARQGKALARFAVENGAEVIVSDLRSLEELQDSILSLEGLDIEYILGEHPMSLLDGADFLAIMMRIRNMLLEKSFSMILLKYWMISLNWVN